MGDAPAEVEAYAVACGSRRGAARPSVGEFEGCHGGPGDGGEDVVSQVGVAARMRRLQQRHPVPAVPRRDRHSGFQQPMVGDLRRGQRAVRCGRRRVRRRQRHRVGARLPAAVGAVRSAASARCADRALQPRPVPRIRNICAAAVATTTRPGDARSPSDRLSAARGRNQLPESLQAGGSEFKGPGVHALSAPNADSTGDARARAADGTYESGVFPISIDFTRFVRKIELARQAAFHGVMHRRAEASRPQRTQGLLRRAVQET